MADNTFNFDLDAPAVPTLTLDPTPAEEEKAAPAQQEAAAPEQPQVNLTPEEQAMVDQFAEKIDITNSQQVLQYGSACQKKIGDFSEAALSKVATKDLGEVGDMITSLIGELKSFDAGEEEKKGILGFFKKKGDQLDAMKMKYNKAETNVEKIQSMLEGHQVQLLKDIAMLDKMYDLNMAYFKELSMYILAGKKKLADVRANELQQAMDKAKASGLPEDAQAARDLADQCERFEKKLYDLELTRNISLQMGPQIRLLQNNNTMMAEKIQSTIVNTIPLWKNQMVLALGLAHSQQAMQAERAVTDMTNDLLKKNAEALKMGYHRDRKGVSARCGGHRDPAADQQEPDRDAGRAEQDPERGPRKARCRRAGAEPHRGRTESKNDGDPELRWQRRFFAKTERTSGGFDAGSYREQKQPEQAVPLTPLQQKLAGLEAKLPAALSTRAAALALSVVVMLAAFLGFGSAKLHSRYNEVRKWYTVGVAADNGYNLNEELTTRMNTAANIITTAGSTLGADSAEVQAAQSALSDLTACLEAVQNGGKSQALTSLPYYQGSTMHALYQANEVLGSRIDQLYAKLQEQAADPMKMGAVQGQYGQFNSAATIIGTLKYNDAVYDYQKETGGFPASVLGSIAGVKEVEPFA